MTKREKVKNEPYKRMPTGVRGLDLLLNGGFLEGGVYLIMGQPGSGKTILGNQLAYTHAHEGGKVLFVTLLAENHARMLGNLSEFEFFNEDFVSSSINYLGAYSIFEKEGLEGLLRHLSQSVRKFKATLLIIDGVTSLSLGTDSELVFKKFVHSLNALLSSSGCTTFLLSSSDGAFNRPEHTMVDGIICLSIERDSMRSARLIEVRKFRGSAHLTGSHFCKIDNRGISIHPRAESYLGKSPAAAAIKPHKIRFEIPDLDAVFPEGILSGSITSILGAAGTGKTTLGMQFLLGGAAKNEAALYFAFYEPPDRLIRKMDALTLPVSKQIKRGQLHILWQRQVDHLFDETIEDLLQTIRVKKIKRLFLDGVAGISLASWDTNRLHRQLEALAHELRAMNVSVFLSEETDLFLDDPINLISDFSAITDNILYFRHVESGGRLGKVLSALKMRESHSPRDSYDYEIVSGGIKISKEVSPKARSR